MNPRTKDILFEIGLWVLLCALGVLMLCAMSGCKGHVQTKGGQVAGEALSRADVRQSYILDEAKTVKPVESAKRITVYAKDTRKDIEQAAQGVATLASDFGNLKDDYTKLEGRWYVRLGRAIQTVLIVAGIAWTALGLFGAFFVGTPGFVGFLARHVLNLLPFANPYTAIARQRQALK